MPGFETRHLQKASIDTLRRLLAICKRLAAWYAFRMKTRQSPCTLPEAAQRSTCPISCALDLLGDKWTLVVIRDLFLGSKTYGDFQKSPESIPTNILADRLKRLEASHLIYRERYQERPVRYSYHLTDSGKRLGATLLELAKWSLLYLHYEGKPEPGSEKIKQVQQQLKNPQ